MSYEASIESPDKPHPGSRGILLYSGGMPNSRYQIEYRDKNGDKHTIQNVSNIKDVVGPLEGEGATGFVVLKQDANGKTEAPTTKSNIAADKAMNGKSSSAPPDDSNDAAGAGEPIQDDGNSAAPASAPTKVTSKTGPISDDGNIADDGKSEVAKNSEDDKKKGKVPAGLAAFIAAKAKAKK